MKKNKSLNKDKKQRVPFGVLTKKGLAGLAMAGLMIASPLMIAGCSDGKDGKDGAPGTIWKSGTDYTLFTDAKVGDYFIDTDDYILYQKGATDWTVVMQNYGKPGTTPQAPSAPVITIVDDYWCIDGVPTGVKAKGEDGKPGNTPEITIVSGYWYVDGVPTNVKAEAQDGHTPVITISQDGYWVIDDVPTQTKATPSVITIVDGYWCIDGVPTGVKAEGKDGNAWIVGTEYPTTANSGDMFLNNSNWNVYQYNGTTWELKGNIKGQNGANGQDGAFITDSASAWYNKSAVFVGDSITYGSKCDGDKYWEVLEDKLQLAEVTGMGVGKSCISATSTNGTSYEPLISRYQSIPEADLIQIFMGTNDYGFNTPLGKIEDTTDVSFYGALNVIIPALQAKYPSSRLVFVTPLHRYGQHGLEYDNDENEQGNTLSDYVNAIREVCEFYSVPVIDLFKVSGLNPSIEAVRNLYMPDGLHPNTEGHEYIANIMANYLELYATSDLNYVDTNEVKELEEIPVERSSPYYPSSTPNCRLSSTYNIYLEKGQVLSIKDGENYKYFLYPQSTPTPTQVSAEDRMSLMDSWTTESFVVSVSGWYGITMGKTDTTQEFDADIIATQTLADYLSIEEYVVKALDEISVERTSPYYPSSTPNCRLSSTYNIYLEEGQVLSIKDGENYKYFLYKQSTPIPTEVSAEDRMALMDSWTTEGFVVSVSGWYGITMGKTDTTQEFDADIIATQTLADYLTIE